MKHRTHTLIESVLAEAYYPCGDQVLLVKDYLDKNFKPIRYSDIDADGQTVERVGIERRVGATGVQPMQLSELLLLLDDRYVEMVADKSDRRRFLKQIIKDWVGGDISKEGILSVNVI